MDFGVITMFSQGSLFLRLSTSTAPLSMDTTLVDMVQPSLCYQTDLIHVETVGSGNTTLFLPSSTSHNVQE